MEQNTSGTGDPDVRNLFMSVAILGMLGFGAVLIFGGYRLIEGHTAEPGSAAVTGTTPASSPPSTSAQTPG